MESPHSYSNTIKKAASRARGDRLGRLYQLCDRQKTITTRKLCQLLDDLKESDRFDALHFKALADQISRQ